MTSQETTKLPNDHVLAVIGGDDTARRAAGELRTHGFENSLLFEGETLAETVDAKGEKSGPLGRLFKAIQEHLSEEPNFLAQYEEEARAGNKVIAVHVDNREAADEVLRVLEPHGARNVRYFGALAVADLTPVTNPSLRSAESPEPQSTT